MTNRNDTTLYVPEETRDRVEETHETVADHPEALPIYATVEAALNALLEEYEQD